MKYTVQHKKGAEELNPVASAGTSHCVTSGKRLLNRAQNTGTFRCLIKQKEHKGVFVSGKPKCRFSNNSSN